MDTRFLLPLCLVLLLLGCEVQGNPLAQQDEPASPHLLAQVQETLFSYWDNAKAAAQGLYERTGLPTVDEQIRDMYSRSSAAISTYTGIFTDQIMTILAGDQ
ncbi:apolipoprotein C-II [Fukomys damarensis]|uniref:Apolipoprotein C-II n=1 Tax=Fukomys damarensis TaxID=885580 RepID=A0A091DN73_FUKDA|nr:apolipoprotein C-II [Fukomys damarensis]KFO33594.1 Apolipoprotein C-II [Fukomys damarensis]